MVDIPIPIYNYLTAATSPSANPKQLAFQRWGHHHQMIALTLTHMTFGHEDFPEIYALNLFSTFTLDYTLVTIKYK